ncbi:MAG: alpha/beta hydrolase [Planctomycetes bacterium]|nr:alpha/beta hydrolase [Planctomycetota bacterium]
MAMRHVPPCHGGIGDRTPRRAPRRFAHGLLVRTLAVLLTGSLAIAATRNPARSGSGDPSDGGALDRLPRDQLLVQHAADGSVQPVHTVDDWKRRREEILDGMRAVMGELDPKQASRGPLDMRVEEEVDCGAYVRRLVSYASEPDCRVPAYLLIPKSVLAESDADPSRGDEGAAPALANAASRRATRRAPAVLCLHGTDNVVGHGTVVGLGTRPNRQYAAELAERGYVTLAPNYPLLAKYQPDLARLGWKSGTLKAVWDNMRGLDLLESLPFVDGERFGAIGHSLGGHNGIFTSVFDDRIDVVVSSCGLDSFVDYYSGDERNWQLERGWCQTRYMPRLADYRGKLESIPFDFHELIGAIAPRHVLIIAPRDDHNFRADSVDRIVAAARPVFALHGHADRLRVEHPPCGHDFPPEMRQAAYALFDRVLKVPER